MATPLAVFCTLGDAQGYTDGYILDSWLNVVKFPLCILFLYLNSLRILWLHLLWCLFLLHFRYSKNSMKNKPRQRLQDEQKWDQ